MINILMVKDCEGWAIGNLANSIMKHNQHFNFIDVPVHPRAVGVSAAPILELINEKGIDLWHAQYWNSGIQLMDIFPDLKKIPSILSHHNHHSLNKGNWSDFNKITIPTDWGYNELRKKHKNIVKVPYGIDLDRFSYITDYKPEEKTIGYIGRVIGHKNLGKIAKGAKKLGYKVIGSGYIDKPDYWKEEVKDKDVIEFHGGMGRGEMMPADFKDKMYERMSIFCMYSTGNKETGTLPLLEAAARGVPILCTDEGMAKDLFVDGESCIKFNEDNFEEKLKLIMEDKKLRLKLRENAYNVIKLYSEELMARRYERLYYNTMYPKHKMISVIIPTFNNADSLLKCIMAVEANEYPKKEIIVCDDGSTDHTRLVIKELRGKIRTTLKYFDTGYESKYGLARARNVGVINSIGDLLLFVDDRIAIKDDVIDKIAGEFAPGSFGFGNKCVKGVPSGKKGFIENFSWIYRKDFINHGMFCERMECYGGMSQEIRNRFSQQGFGFSYFPNIMADEIKKSSSKQNRKKDIWKAKLLLQKLYE